MDRLLSQASNAAESQTASTKYVMSRSKRLHLFTPLPETWRPCCLRCNRVLPFLPLWQSTFLYRCLLILPYPPRQGSHRWAIHDTVTTNHGANAAFTMPRYICTAPSAYQPAPSAQVRHPCLCRAFALGVGSKNQRRSCQLSCARLCAPLLSSRQHF